MIRQWSERFGDNVTGRLKAESLRLLGVGVMLLVIGAAAIVFSRSYLVAEAVARSEALGEEGASTVSIYGLALIMNVFVYAIGLAWAIVFHDPVPSFMEERHRLEVLRARLRKRYRTLLEPKQRQRIEEAQRARDQGPPRARRIRPRACPTIPVIAPASRRCASSMHGCSRCSKTTAAASSCRRASAGSTRASSTRI